MQTKAFWDKPRQVLITGGAGFIGCNLVDRLVGKGHCITIFDNLSRQGAEKNLSWLKTRYGDNFRFVKGDICDRLAVNQVMAGIEIIFHLAGQTAVTTSIKDPHADFEANALGTFNVLEGARLFADNPIFLYSSTNKVYGGMEDIAIVEHPIRYDYRDMPLGVNESQSLDFHSPYGCSKGAADQYVRDYYRIYGLPTIVFRQSAIYGPRQMGREDQGWVAWFLIATFLGKPITIYGDGKQVRDLLYIDDLIDAYERVVAHSQHTAGQIYNIGGGSKKTISIWHEFKPILEDVLGYPLQPVQFSDGRPGDQYVTYFDTSKAMHDFGWYPKVGIREGIRCLARWVQNNLDLFH